MKFLPVGVIYYFETCEGMKASFNVFSRKKNGDDEILNLFFKREKKFKIHFHQPWIESLNKKESSWDVLEDNKFNSS